MLTGEPVPVDVGPGAEVAGATVNAYGRLVVRATRVGAETALAQIARLVAEAQAGKAPIQRLVDRVSGVFVPIVIALSLATLAGWLVFDGDVADAFTASVAVLIIACPCALGLATPDGAHGRDGPRRPARDPHQGPRGARADEARDDDRARQDRHGHRGPHAARRRRPGERRHARRRAPPRRRRRGRERASDRPRGRRGGPQRARLAPDGPGLREQAGPRRHGASRRARRRGRTRRDGIDGVLGRAAACDARRRRHGEADERGGGRRAARARADAGPPHR